MMKRHLTQAEIAKALYDQRPIGAVREAGDRACLAQHSLCCTSLADALRLPIGTKIYDDFLRDCGRRDA